MHAFKTELYLRNQKVATKYKRTRTRPSNNKIGKNYSQASPRKGFSSVCPRCLNQAYLRHKLESSDENEKFNHVKFVNIEDFSMQNDSITLIFTKNYGV